MGGEFQRRPSHASAQANAQQSDDAVLPSRARLGGGRMAGVNAERAEAAARLKTALTREAAAKYNADNKKAVAEFNRLTNRACAVGPDAIDMVRLQAWQRARGLNADGKVGPQTLTVARAEGKPNAHAESISFDGDARAEAPIEGSTTGPNIFEGEEGPDMPRGSTSLADVIAEDGDTRGQEKRTHDGAKEQTERNEHMGNAVGEGFEHGLEGAPAVEAAGVKGTAAVKGLAFLPQLPHLVDLLRAHDYKGAIMLVANATTNWEERGELAHLALEKLGGELGENVAKWFVRAAAYGAAADVLALGWEWTKLGLESIREAHEKGDQDARIGIYAFAWSDCVVNGGHTNAGVVGEEQREAMQLGIRDGLATRDRYPELEGLLLAEYGNKVNARRALQDALYKSAGIAGVVNHHER